MSDRRIAGKAGLIAALLAFSLIAASPANAKPAALTYVKVATAEQPTVLASPPGYPRLVFVAEKAGRIRVMQRGRWKKTPLLDLRKLVASREIERGLLGLAFAPDFRKTGRFYVDYTARGGNSVVAEYRTMRRRPTRLVPGSRRKVIEIPRVNNLGNHNGGHLEFVGRLLLVSVGDGFNPGDQAKNAANLESLRGKLLRIDPRPDPATGAGYRIPPSNPFVGLPGRDEIFSYGLRNPHGVDVFRPDGGAAMIVISDVGQFRFEELNYLPLTQARGADFGWNRFEGFKPYDCGELCPNGVSPGSSAGLTWPQLAYSHDEGCAIIGGPVIEDPALTSVKGRIIYGDFCRGRIRTAAPANPLITDDKPAGFFLPPGEGKHVALNGFGVDGFNRIYAFSQLGGIYRIVQR